MTGALVPLLALALPLAEPPAGPTAPRLDRLGFTLPDGAVARLGHKDRRLRSETDWATFSDDGRYVARPVDGEPRVFDLRSGRDVTPAYLKDHRGAVVHLLSPGRHLIVSPRRGDCLVADAESGRPVATLDLAGEYPNLVDTTPDGRGVVVTFRENDLHSAAVFDLSADPPVRRLFRSKNYNDNWRLSADGARLFHVWENGVEVLDARNGDVIATLAVRARNPALPLLVSEDGTAFVAAFERGLAAYRLTADGIAEPQPVQVDSDSLTLSADGRTLFTTHRGRYELDGGPIDYTPAHDRSGVRFTRFARYGRLALDTFADRPPVVWDPTTGKTVFRFPQYSAVKQIQFGPGGTVVTRHADRAVRGWELPDGRMVGDWTGRTAAKDTELLAVTPNGRTVIERDAKESAVVLTSSDTGAVTATWPQKFDEAAECVRVDPTGRQVLVSGRKAAGLFDLATGRRLREVTPSPTHDFSPDGKLLTTVTPTAVKVIELASGKERAVLPIPTTDFDVSDENFRRFRSDSDDESGASAPRGTIQFAADNATVALFGTTGRVLVWSVSDGILRYRETTGARGGRLGALRPDGRWVAYTVRSSRRVALRDLTEARADRNAVFLPTQSSNVTALAFTPDGRHLITGHEDGLCVVWDVDELIARGRPTTTADPIDDLWATLGDPDAAAAGRAADELTRTPSAAVHLIGQMMKPDADPDAKRVAEEMTRLGDREFAVRERAEKWLRAQRELVAPDLRTAQTQAAQPEVRERVDRLVIALDGPEADPHRLRAHRAVEVLERVGTPEAKRLLRSLAGGSDRSAVTREAALAVERLTARGR
jgi:WD40 repeat protein